MGIISSPPIGGIKVSDWVDLFNSSHSIGEGIIFNSWPNGKPYLEQEMMLVSVFRIIKDELIKMRKSNG